MVLNKLFTKNEQPKNQNKTISVRRVSVIRMYDAYGMMDGVGGRKTETNNMTRANYNNNMTI